MKVVKFKSKEQQLLSKKKMEIFGDIEFSALKTTRSTKTDLRFCLYEKVWVDQKPVINVKAILVDIDNVSLLQGAKFRESVEQVFGNYKMYHLFTGNGHHIYIPLQQSHNKEVADDYMTDYLTKLVKLDAVCGHETDKSVTNKQQYGRVPYSTNSKNGNLVMYMGENNYPVAESVDTIIKRIPKPKAPQLPIKPTAETGLNSVIYRHCNFLKHFHENAQDMPYTSFKHAMSILSVTKDVELGLEIAKNHKHGQESEVRRFIETNTYKVRCTTISDSFKEAKVNPCQGCPHNQQGSCPSYITGELPTPSAINGFHPVKEVKDEETGEKTLEIDFSKICLDEVFNKWTNLNKDNVRVLGEGYINYAQGNWQWLLHKKKDGTDLPVKTKRELYEIPYKYMDKNKDTKYILEKFKFTANFEEVPVEEINRPTYINFINGVFDIDNLSFHDHDKDFYLMGITESVFNPDAVCPRWEAFVKQALPEACDRELLQVFAGLSLSNISNIKYQKYLWMYGASGSGKSAIMRIISNVIGKSRTQIINSKALGKDGKEGFPHDLTGKSLMILDDYKPTYKDLDNKAFESIVNVLTGGIDVMIRKLWVDGFPIDPKATFVVTSNDKPIYTHEESGTLRRLRVLYFYTKPERETKDFEEVLLEEREGILQWCIRGLKNYLENGMPPLTPSEQFEFNELRAEVDEYVPLFCKTYIKVCPTQESEVTFKKLYNTFINKMGVDYTSLTQKKFTNQVIQYITIKYKVPKRVVFKRGSENKLVGFSIKESD